MSGLARSSSNARLRKFLTTLSTLLIVLATATICTAVVTGSTRPAPGLVPHPLIRNAVKQALLDGAELSRIFGQSFTTDPDTPPQSGGADLLQENVYDPPLCGGVAAMLMADSYAGAHVRDVASENWLYSGADPSVVMVTEAVVGLPTSAAADALFTTMAQQWTRCGGATTTIGGDSNFTFTFSSIQKAGSVVAASVDQFSDSVALSSGRAIGMEVNCLVEIEVVCGGAGARDDPAHRKPSAADTARRLMDKVRARS